MINLLCAAHELRKVPAPTSWSHLFFHLVMEARSMLLLLLLLLLFLAASLATRGSVVT